MSNPRLYKINFKRSSYKLTAQLVANLNLHFLAEQKKSTHLSVSPVEY